jgi:hypothetical protein
MSVLHVDEIGEHEHVAQINDRTMRVYLETLQAASQTHQQGSAAAASLG